MTLKLEELEVYKVSMEIGELVYRYVSPWRPFDKYSLGKQFVEAADSIALNVAEGYGRFYYKENKMFNYYSRGSAKETGSCARKAFERKLINQQDFNILEEKLNLYLKLSYWYINSIGTTKP